MTNRVDEWGAVGQLTQRLRFTVLKGKFRIYRNGENVIQGVLLSWKKNFKNTVMEIRVIHEVLLSWRKNSKNTVIENGVIDEGLLS